MARQKQLDPHKYQTFWLPVKLVERLNEFCIDPILGKPRHGMQSQIAGMLITNFLDAQDKLKGSGFEENATETQELPE